MTLLSVNAVASNRGRSAAAGADQPATGMRRLREQRSPQTLPFGAATRRVAVRVTVPPLLSAMAERSKLSTADRRSAPLLVYSSVDQLSVPDGAREDDSDRRFRIRTAHLKP